MRTYVVIYDSDTNFYSIAFRDEDDEPGKYYKEVSFSGTSDEIFVRKVVDALNEQQRIS